MTILSSETIKRSSNKNYVLNYLEQNGVLDFGSLSKFNNLATDIKEQLEINEGAEGEPIFNEANMINDNKHEL